MRYVWIIATALGLVGAAYAGIVTSPWLVVSLVWFAINLRKWVREGAS